MIVVDSSVWIDLLRNRRTDAVQKFEKNLPDGTILLGDIIITELLMGVKSEGEARELQAWLTRFPQSAMLSPELAVRAAANYRHLRGLGITIRRTTDLIIGTFCIERGYALLHADRDFEPMFRHLGLRAL